MRTGFQISSLVPSGLVFDGVSDSTDSLILAVGSEAAGARCALKTNTIIEYASEPNLQAD